MSCTYYCVCRSSENSSCRNSLKLSLRSFNSTSPVTVRACRHDDVDVPFVGTAFNLFMNFVNSPLSSSGMKRIIPVGVNQQWRVIPDNTHVA